MKKLILANKPKGFYTNFLLRLKKIELSVKSNSKKSYIPFPIIFERSFGASGITKEHAWEILFLMEEFGFIKVIPFHGIKLDFEVKNA